MTHPLDDAARHIVGSPQRLVAQTIEVAATLSDARSGAVFLLDGNDHLKLFASVGLDERGLERTRCVWERHGRERAGMYRSADAEGAFVLIPLLEEGRVLGLMYLAGTDRRFGSAPSHARLVELGSIVGRAVQKARGLAVATIGRAVNFQDYLEQTPPQEIAREQLFVLLDRNEWNIARVARIMGVTRRTIYLRMRRFKIERQRVRKTKTRPAIA